MFDIRKRSVEHGEINGAFSVPVLSETGNKSIYLLLPQQQGAVVTGSHFALLGPGKHNSGRSVFRHSVYAMLCGLGHLRIALWFGQFDQ